MSVMGAVFCGVCSLAAGWATALYTALHPKQNSLVSLGRRSAGRGTGVSMIFSIECVLHHYPLVLGMCLRKEKLTPSSRSQFGF